MPIPQELTDILSEFGVPAGAVALAAGLVRGAGALEADASDNALRYVSGLLTKGGLAGFGKTGATLVPLIFDRVFGSKPFTFKFLSRSIAATTLFWAMLLLVKHPNLGRVWQGMVDVWLGAVVMLPLWYLIDWVSLIKARFLIRIMSERHAVTSSVLFFCGRCLDIISHPTSIHSYCSWGRHSPAYTEC